MEKLDFDITKKPPTQAEIDAEKMRLKGKIKSYRIKVLSASILIIFIAVSIMMWVHPTDTSDVIAAGVIAAGIGAVAGIVGAVGAFIAVCFGIGTSLVGIVIAIVAAGMAGAIGSTIVCVAAIATGIVVFNGIKPIENQISELAVSDCYQSIKRLRNRGNQIAKYLLQIDKQSRKVTVFEYRELNFVAHQS